MTANKKARKVSVKSLAPHAKVEVMAVTMDGTPRSAVLRVEFAQFHLKHRTLEEVRDRINDYLGAIGYKPSRFQQFANGVREMNTLMNFLLPTMRIHGGESISGAKEQSPKAKTAVREA